MKMTMQDVRAVFSELPGYCKHEQNIGEIFVGGGTGFCLSVAWKTHGPHRLHTVDVSADRIGANEAMNAQLFECQRDSPYADVAATIREKRRWRYVQYLVDTVCH